MQTRLSVEETPQKVSHLVIDADEATPVQSVVSAISRATGATSSLPGESQRTWGELGIVEGSIISATSRSDETVPTEHNADHSETLLSLVSGAGAGTIWSLAPGKFTVGSDAYCTVVLEDPQIPGVAALLTVQEDGSCRVENTTETPAVFMEGQAVTDSVVWEQGHCLRIGEYVFEIITQSLTQASVSASEKGGLLDFNRPPRLMPKPRETDFKYPTEPEMSSKGALPLIGMLVPLLLAVVLAIVMKRPYFLIFGLMSPVMMMANYFSNRKSGKVTYREKKAKYRKVRAQVEEDLHQAVVDFANERRLSSPDPATAGLIATMPSPRLWERRRTDPDHLTIRIGVAEVESDVSLYRPEEVDHRRTQQVHAKDVPVTVSLQQFGVVGLCGESDVVHRSAGWMVAQLAITQSPRDMGLVILTDATSQKEWEWARWLPHVASTKGAVAAIGNDTRTVGQRLNELVQMIEQRQEMAQSKDTEIFRAIVVVFDGARKLRQWPGASRVLAEGPGVGIYAVCIDSEERFLPEESRAIISTHHGLWTLKRDREDSLEKVTADLPAWNWFEWVARAVAPIRDASDESDSAIPTSARFLSTVMMEDPEADLVAQRWAQSPRSTSAVIGESFDGAFEIDIRKDGPHALIAGTTGSGKSELLQTLIASLALGNRPDELNFVLIDYKGGAAFKDFLNLPHTVGIVTDLDAHLVQRAMDSLAAELRRREHLLATVGAKDIEDFTSARERGETGDKMPRLMLVIDEFAALKAELPEFVAGIVNIAQRGRSLGIHLVMATQRPQGAITADILANTNLRIALRMADSVESKDVIGTSDAAEISTSTPGRAYVKSGSSPLLPFQSSRIGGARPSSVTEVVADPVVDVVAWEAVGYPLPKRAQVKGADSAVTDLQVLVGAMEAAATQLGIEPQPSPWLDPVADIVTLDQVTAKLPVSSAEDLPRIPFGLQDFPADQDQRPACLDFEELSHLFIVGSPRTGRTQALRTIAGSIASFVSANDVHLYGVDFGNGGLQGLLQLPHCNTVISRTQGALLTRFISQMESEVASRRAQLSAAGFASVSEQRRNVPADQKIPHIVILFDQWEGFLNGIGDNCQSSVGQAVLGLLREGASAGIHLIIAGDRSLLSSRTNSLVEHKYLLRLADRTDYAMAGLSPRELPEKIGSGRAFESATSRETQFAVLDADVSSQAQVRALGVIGESAIQAQGTVELVHVPAVFKDLPVKVSYPQVLSAAGGARALVPWRPVLGIGGQDVGPVSVDLMDIPTFIVGGSTRSGKSTALVALTRSCLDAGVPVVLMTPLRSPLRELAAHPSVVASYAGADITAEVVREVLAMENILLVVDDASAITDYPVTDEFKKIGAALNNNGLRVIAADGLDELDRVGALSWMNELVKRRHGALLDPASIFSGKPFGLALNQEILGQVRPVGRALVNVGDGRVTLVQVASGGEVF
ncbi:cell division protein FtsK [Rothia amarae]|uniref:Cell division protein FtsK n=1 Tax=Rothia amarae TaxID=169480 RepID=A0A7H2BJJ6_9MICC|nr:FtsK/SpoIIIE domain-containing protein [Rothia amarae]QNV39842.1 cell division protein FtsK [Rothia amarae]